MKTGNTVSLLKQRRSLGRAISLLFGFGLIICLLAIGFAWYGQNYSGKLVLAQTIPAVEASRGFDFGPVYLTQGTTSRYFLSALIPPATQDYWLTSFEVLDEQLQPVYRQDEVRFIGDHQFTPGEHDRYSKTFKPDKATGYFYFRFTAQNGAYNENQLGKPVVEFSVRSGVLAGTALWGPVAALFGFGLLVIGLGVGFISKLGMLGQVAESGAPGQTVLAQATDLPGKVGRKNKRTKR